MHLGRRRFEANHVTAILDGGHVPVERLPLVGNDDHSAASFERPRNALFIERGGSRLPGDSFHRIGLAEAFEQPHRVAFRIETIDVVQHHHAITVMPGRGVGTERRRVAFDPARVGDGTPYGLAFRQSWLPQQDQQIQMPGGERFHEPHQLFVTVDHKSGRRMLIR